ncbi:glycoside hydrolase [Spirochaeta cellobiosiphila]|uniref:glycoside hydrolase n=1 Tax=Spirochaeta cellobiosiphila TaxID=504483 RepID=UPI00048CF03E
MATGSPWGSDMYKFKNEAKVQELLEMFYLNPPLYKMSRNRLKEKKKELIHNYQSFFPLPTIY